MTSTNTFIISFFFFFFGFGFVRYISLRKVHFVLHNANEKTCMQCIASDEELCQSGGHRARSVPSGAARSSAKEDVGVLTPLLQVTALSGCRWMQLKSLH